MTVQRHRTSSPGPALPRQTVSDDVQTYLFNARYRPNDDLSLYVRIADGYRPASANLPLRRSRDWSDPLRAVRRSDSLWSYEVGAKGKFAGGLLGLRRRGVSHQVGRPAGVPQLHGRERRRQRGQRRDGERHRSDAHAAADRARSTSSARSRTHAASSTMTIRAVGGLSRRAAARHSGVDVLAVRQLRLHARLARSVRRRRCRLPG